MSTRPQDEPEAGHPDDDERDLDVDLDADADLGDDDEFAEDDGDAFDADGGEAGDEDGDAAIDGPDWSDAAAAAPTWNPPLVALVGRPNVGKSTLFNRLIGQRTAITFDTPGVTRDRHYALARYGLHQIQVIDTGGFAPGESEGMLPLMRQQAQIAIDEADAIIFMTCAREGLLPADEEIARVLRRTQKPVFLCANKADTPSLDADAMAMYALGFDEVWPIAAEHNRGVLDLMEAVENALGERGHWEGEPDHDEKPQLERVRGGRVERVRVCFVGKPNVGKSTLINKLLGHERVICADQPGTTRDAIDVDFVWRNRAFTLVDTAGLRRKRAVHDLVEQYSVSQSVRAIERSHVAVLVLDATQGLSDQDSKIAALVQDRGRACVVAVNKWDAVEGKDSKLSRGYELDLERIMPFLSYCPKVFLSAKTGQRVEKTFETVEKVYENFNRRVPTHQFNKWLIALQERVQPPTFRGRKLRMYYGAQLAVRPPKFVISVNMLGAISPAYQRFLINQIRETWDFEGVPIRLDLKKKPERKARRVTEALAVSAVTGEDPTLLGWDGVEPHDFGGDDDDGDEDVGEDFDGVDEAHWADDDVQPSKASSPTKPVRPSKTAK
ncbi:MAG: ribosome biogenesis GTPase Der [Deltaproteobacteria bacterium]|nr:ribosome biogenesis GTPase Der [Deltaproteobacteria bacterium]